MQLSFVHYLPIFSTVLAFFFAWKVYQRYQERGGNHLWWWSFGLLVYGLGTFAEGWMTLLGWNVAMFKFWYVVGALMGGAPLAQGTVWLLLPARWARRLTYGLVAALIVPAVCVVASPINYAVVDPHVPSGSAFAWQWVRAFSPFINTYAVIFLIGGAFYSAWKFGAAAQRNGFGASVVRDRFFGNVWIAVGAILPGIGGAASRMGRTEWLYIGEFVGIILIWAGYWLNVRRRDAATRIATAVSAAVLLVLLVSPLGVVAQTSTSLQIDVLAPDGGALPGATVQVIDETGSVRVATTDARGRALVPVAGNAVTVEIRLDGYRVWSRPVRVTAGDTTAVVGRLELAPLAERVTVVATQTERGVNQIPGEAAVIERQELELVQARNLDDVMRYVPGVEMSDTARTLGQTINIRGFDERRVLTLKDGARISQYNSAHKGSGFFDVEDVQTVEIAKGAASALYGSGAIGGVLSLTTRDPGAMLRPGRSLGASIRTSFSTAYGDAMITPRLFGQSRSGLGWMVSYTGRRNDGTVDLAGDPSEMVRAEEDINSYTARITTPAGTRNALRFSFDQYNQSGASSTNLSIVEPGAAEAVGRDTRQTTFNLRFDRAGSSFWDEALGVTAYYTDMGIDEERPVDGRVDDINFRTWGVNLSNSVRRGVHTVTYGAEYVDDRQVASRDAAPNAFFPNGTRREIGVFVQDEIRLANDRLLLVPGIRLDHFRSAAENAELPTQEFTRLSPKFGASYNLTDQLVATASYGEGFRAPFFQELFPEGVHFAFPTPPFFLLALFEPNPELRPERSRGWDAGLRFSTGDVRVRAAYWESYVNDFIDLLPVATLPPDRGLILQIWQSVNRVDAVLRGVEASADWQFHENLVFRAAYSTSTGTDRATDEALLQIPPSKLVVGLGWHAPSAGLNLAWATRAYGARDDVPAGVDPTESYVLHDIHARWAPRFLADVSLYTSINNLANTEYQDPRFGTPGIARDVRFGLGFVF